MLFPFPSKESGVQILCPALLLSTQNGSRDAGMRSMHCTVPAEAVRTKEAERSGAAAAPPTPSLFFLKQH